MRGHRVLVRLDESPESAAVLRTPDGVWLTDRLSRGGLSEVSGSEPTKVGLVDGMLFGGLMPDGAVAARLTDELGVRREVACGGGAWLARVDHDPVLSAPPVCFFDAAGELVAFPADPGVTRTPVTDAIDACPACDAMRWQQESTGPGGRYRVVCGSCGHRDFGWLHPIAVRDEVPEAEVIAWHRRQDERAAAALRGLRFTLLAVVGYEMEVTGWGRGLGPVDRVTLTYRDEHTGVLVEVDTDSEPYSRELALTEAALGLSGLLDDAAGSPLLSDAALVVWSSARQRERFQRVARAEPRTQNLPVDGVLREFALVEVGGCWAATAIVDGKLATVVAREIPIKSVALHTLSSPPLETETPRG